MTETIMNQAIAKPVWRAVCFSVLIWITGCTTAQSADVDVSATDPLEPVNRSMYWVNDFLDEMIAQPLADIYVAYTPKPVRNSVSNFLDNMAYPSVILNDFLQGKGNQGLEDSGRFVVNSTFGFFGIWDVATPLGLEAHNEDFGQTLGVWGMGEGTYLVLPLVGPTSLRDAPNVGAGAVTNILLYVSNPVAIPVSLLGFIDRRARVADAVHFRDKTAVEPYLFTREAYLQHRKFLIYDGDPPIEDDEFFDAIFVDRDPREDGTHPEETEDPARSPEREAHARDRHRVILISDPASVPASD